MTWKLIALFALAIGCKAQLGDEDSQGTAIDAGPKRDASASTIVDAASVVVDAPAVPAACPNNRKVYLHFDGNLTLTDAATSDSVNNQARWLTNASAAIPAWRPGAGDRATQIQTVFAGVKQRLAGLPIEVVTQRPAAGPYVMIVFGGRHTQNGGTVGTPYSLATSYHDCGDLVKNDVGWVSEDANTSFAQDLAVGAIGWGLGLDGTTANTDCMCGWANGCSSAAGACTLSANISTLVNNGIETACQGGAAQNEIAAFSVKFCQL